MWNFYHDDNLYDDALYDTLFVDSDDERKFIRKFIEEVNRHSPKTPGNSPKLERERFGFLRPMIKGVYLFWIDYHAFRASGDAEDLECKRAYISDFMARHKQWKKDKEAVTDDMIKMYEACCKEFLKHSKGFATLEDDAAAESNAFYAELPKHGVFVRDGYEELRLRIYKFLLWRKEDIMRSLDELDDITPQNGSDAPPYPDAKNGDIPPALSGEERERRARLIDLNMRGAVKKIARKLPEEYICSAEADPSVPGQILIFKAKDAEFAEDLPCGEIGRVYVAFNCRDMSVKSIRGRMEAAPGPGEPGKDPDAAWKHKMSEMKGIADIVHRVFYNEGLVKTLPPAAPSAPRQTKAPESADLMPLLPPVLPDLLKSRPGILGISDMPGKNGEYMRGGSSLAAKISGDVNESISDKKGRWILHRRRPGIEGGFCEDPQELRRKGEETPPGPVSEVERAITEALREPRARLERGLSGLSDWVHTEESIHAQGRRVTFSFVHESMGELGLADVTLSGPGMAASAFGCSVSDSGDERGPEREELMRYIFDAVKEAFS
jgi:hypothetical protein